MLAFASGRRPALGGGPSCLFRLHVREDVLRRISPNLRHDARAWSTEIPDVMFCFVRMITSTPASALPTRCTPARPPPRSVAPRQLARMALATPSHWARLSGATVPVLVLTVIVKLYDDDTQTSIWAWP
jgi:hypothetical protein